MQIIQTNPTDGQVVSNISQIVITFDKTIDPNTFTTSMASIFDENDNVISYTHSISGTDLILIPQSLTVGRTYRVFFGGVDIFTNTTLKATDGEEFSDSIEFTFKLIEQQQPEIKTIDIQADDVFILSNAKYVLNTNAFWIKFSENIQSQQVECYVTTENFDGMIQFDKYIITQAGVVVDTSTEPETIVQEGITGNTFTIQLNYFQPNCIITLEIPEIQFANGISQSYTFTLATQLQPYFNVRLIKSKFGAQQNLIQDTDVYLQLYETFIKAEDLFRTKILGTTTRLDSNIRMFISEYQYWQLYETLVMQKALGQGDRLTTANTTIVNGDVSNSVLKYIANQKEQIVQKYVRITAQVQERGISHPYTHYEKAKQRVERLKEVWLSDNTR